MLKRINQYKMGMCLIVMIVGWTVGFGTTISPAMAQETSNLGIMSFDIENMPNDSFLGAGIADMLASRLYWEGKISTNVIDKADIPSTNDTQGSESDKVAKLGKALGMDFMLYGKLMLKDDMYMLEAQLIKIEPEMKTFRFSQQSRDKAGLMKNINTLAQDINRNIFGRIEPGLVRKSPQQKTNLLENIEKPDQLIEIKPDINEENLAKKGSEAATLYQEQQELSFKYWKSKEFKEQFVGIAIADVDKDGLNETILIDDHHVMILKVDKNRNIEQKVVYTDRGRHFVGLQVADINANGYQEIFISALAGNHRDIDSVVLEYDGNTYKPIDENLGWIFGLIDNQDSSKQLLGQSYKNNDSIFSGPIVYLGFDGKHYVEKGQTQLPANSNVLGLALGEVVRFRRPMVVRYNSRNLIEVINQKGQVVAQSEKRLGGGMTYRLGSGGERETGSDREYFPPRILVRDFDQDNYQEMITVNNLDLIDKNKRKARKEAFSQIEYMIIENATVKARWKTSNISGYITDIACGDFDNNGDQNLMAITWEKTGKFLFTKTRSYLIEYTMEKPAK